MCSERRGTHLSAEIVADVDHVESLVVKLLRTKQSSHEQNSAWRALFQAIAPRIEESCRRSELDQTESDMAALEVFGRLKANNYANLRKMNAGGNKFWPWVLQQCKWEVANRFDELAAVVDFQSEPNSDIPGSSTSPQPTSATLASISLALDSISKQETAKQQAALLEDAIDSLSLEQKTAFETFCRHLEDKKKTHALTHEAYTHAAQSINQDIDETKKLIHATKQRIKRHLKKRANEIRAEATNAIE